MSVGEFELINQYFKRGNASSTVSLGIGDDCALLNVPAGKQLAISTDTLVADVHFPANGDPERIAERALCVSLSDLAAMGAQAHWFTLSLTLPRADKPWLAGFSKGLFRTADKYHCELVGGDTTRGPLTISVQVMGSVTAGAALTRAGAQVGDLIFVTGNLGDGAGALAAMEARIKPDTEALNSLLERYYHPVPRLKSGQKLLGIASSAIDISDGLLQDLGHICQSSSVAAEIAVEAIPVSAALQASATGAQRQEWALTGGDDYQLCFTVPPTKLADMEQLITLGLDASPIGKIVKGSGVACRYLGESISVNKQGYRHFD